MVTILKHDSKMSERLWCVHIYVCMYETGTQKKCESEAKYRNVPVQHSRRCHVSFLLIATE